MRVTAFVLAMLLATTGLAFAQEWEEYVSTRDGFSINFPGKPAITDTTWTSELGYVLPARVYSAERGREHYSVTVADYTGIETLGVERLKTCPPGNEQCRADGVEVVGAAYWKQDERGAIVYATFKLLQRDARLTNLAWEFEDMVEGHFVQLVNNSDQSRTFAFIGMHEHKLYIVEGTVPRESPEPGLFQQSMGWVDKDGRGIRYRVIYSNAYHGMGIYPKPPLVGGTAAAPPASGR